jgi:hypothetical protein
MPLLIYVKVTDLHYYIIWFIFVFGVFLQWYDFFSTANFKKAAKLEIVDTYLCSKIHTYK